MRYEEIRCRVCGGALKKLGEGSYCCNYCGALWERDNLDDYMEQVRASVRGEVTEALLMQQQERIANIRYNLHRTVHQRNIDGNAVKHYCEELKKYLPEDLQAEFYSLAWDDAGEVNRFLDGVDVKKAGKWLIEDMINYTRDPLRMENLSSLRCLVERAFQDDPALQEQYDTFLDEDEKMNRDGVYNETKSRDVFLAYKSEDIKIVNELCDYLERNGLECFLATRNLKHGRDARNLYEDRLYRAIDNCRVVVFISTRLSRTLGNALEIEFPYIEKIDRQNAPVEYKNMKYSQIPAKYKKPRVEYLVEYRTGVGSEENVRSFFTGFTYRRKPETVCKAVKEFLGENDDEDMPWTQAAAAPAVKYCLACGSSNQSQAKYCLNCGNHEFGTEEQFKAKSIQKARTMAAEEKRKEKKVKREEERRQAEQKRAEEKRQEEKRRLQLKKQQEAARQKKAKARKAARQDRWDGFCSAVSEYGLDVGFAISSVIMLAALVLIIVIQATQLCWVANTLWLSLWSASCGYILLHTVFIIVYAAKNGFSWDWDEEWPLFIYILCGILCAFFCVVLWIIGSAWFSILPVVITGLATIVFAFGSIEIETDQVCANVGFALFELIFIFVAVVFFAGGLLDQEYCFGYRWYDDTILYRIEEDDSVSLIAVEPEEGCFILPTEVNGHRVASVQFETFEGVEKIGFWGEAENIPEIDFDEFPDLTTVTLPSGLVEVSSDLFASCTALENVYLPESVERIGSNAFYECSSLSYVSIPDNVEQIEQSAFYRCGNLSSVSFGENSALKELGSYAFYECSSLSYVSIPDNVERIGKGAFYRCVNLSSVSLGESSALKELGSYAFGSCTSLRQITIPKGITVLQEGVLSSCEMLSSASFAEDSMLERIGKGAFFGCSALSGFVIPDSVLTIEEDAFSNCENVIWTEDGISYVDRWVVDCEYSSSSAYDEIRLRDDTVGIADYAFSNSIKTKSGYFGAFLTVVLPKQIKAIGDEAFSDCTGLAEVNIPASVDSIGYMAFGGCINLKSVIFEDPAGWWCSASEEAIAGTLLDVTDASKNASQLRSQYCEYFWKKG